MGHKTGDETGGDDDDDDIDDTRLFLVTLVGEALSTPTCGGIWISL